MDKVALVVAALVGNCSIGRRCCFREDEEKFDRVKGNSQVFVHSHQVVIIPSGACTHGQINSFRIIRRFVFDGNRSRVEGESISLEKKETSLLDHVLEEGLKDWTREGFECL